MFWQPQPHLSGAPGAARGGVVGIRASLRSDLQDTSLPRRAVRIHPSTNTTVYTLGPCPGKASSVWHSITAVVMPASSPQVPASTHAMSILWIYCEMTRSFFFHASCWKSPYDLPISMVLELASACSAGHAKHGCKSLVSSTSLGHCSACIRQ